MKKLALVAGAVGLSANAAIAKCIGSQCATAVPEISALEGTAALAAVAAVVLLAWERRRRAV